MATPAVGRTCSSGTVKQKTARNVCWLSALFVADTNNFRVWQVHGGGTLGEGLYLGITNGGVALKLQVLSFQGQV